MKELILKNINKNNKSVRILYNINIVIEKGDILCILGPSGCGKTSLLRIIAGLDKPDSGEIFYKDKNIINIPPYKRNFSMMFQDFALFPHKNVFENIAFGLEMKKTPKSEIEYKVKEMLELVNLSGFEKRNIEELSGGEKQRVGLARTLAPSPNFIMLDEPLGSIDKVLREKLLEDIVNIIKKIKISTIFVTHDQEEAFTAADYISVMDQGKILQTDRPKYIYKNPLDIKVANFLGFRNIIKGYIIDENTVKTEEGIFQFSYNINYKEKVNLLILPDSAFFIGYNTNISEHKNIIIGIVKNIFFKGYYLKIEISTINNNFFFNATYNNKLPKKGEKIIIKIPEYSLRLVED